MPPPSPRIAPSDSRLPVRSRKKRLARIGVLSLGAALLIYLLPTAMVADAIATTQRWFEACRDAGPVPFFVLMALLPSIGFPLAPFTLTAGPLFGPTLGVGTVILCSTFAVAINVSLSYWIAARFMRPLMTRLIAWLGYQLPQVGDRSAWISTLLFRIVPGPPFFLQSYLLALIGVPFGIYMLVSTLVPLGYISSMVLFGDAIARGDPWAAAGAVGLLFIVGGILHQLRKRWSKLAPDSPELPSTQTSEGGQNTS